MVVRRVAAGFLSGASIIVGVMTLMMFAFFVAGIWGLMYDQAGPFASRLPFWQRLGGSLANSFAAAPSYFWSARWGIIAIGLLGMVLALVDAARMRISRPWQPWTGVCVVLGVTGALVIGSLYSSRESTVAVLADDPQSFAARDALLANDSTLLFIGLLVTLGIGYIIWASWNFWYRAWGHWLHVADVQPRRQTVSAAEQPAQRNEWIEYQERLSRLRSKSDDEDSPAASPAPFQPDRSWLRFVLLGLAAATVAGYLLLRVYHSVAPEVVSGEMWVNQETPAVATNLSLDRAPQRLILSNSAGAGTIEAHVRDDARRNRLRSLPSMTLSGSADRYVTAVVDLQGLQPGDYQVEVRLQEGAGGLVRFVAQSGGGVPGGLAAWGFGIVAGLWVALAVLALLEVLAVRGALQGAR